MKWKNLAFGYLCEIHFKWEKPQGTFEEQREGQCCWKGVNQGKNDKNTCQRQSTGLEHVDFYATVGI